MCVCVNYCHQCFCVCKISYLFIFGNANTGIYLFLLIKLITFLEFFVVVLDISVQIAEQNLMSGQTTVWRKLWSYQHYFQQYSISVISWQSVLLMEETGVPGENHQPTTSHWHTWSQCCIKYTSSKWDSKSQR